MERTTSQAAWPLEASALDWQKRFLAGGLWVFAGRVLGVLTTLLSNVILARLLTPDDFGNFLLTISLAGVGAIVAMFGMNGAMVKLVGESVGVGDHQRARRALRLGGTVAATSILLVGLIAPWVLYFILPEIKPTGMLLVSISIGIMLIAWQQVAAEGLRGLHDQRWASFLTGGQISGPLTALLFIAFVLAAALTRHLALSQTIWLMDLALVLTVGVCMYCLYSTISDRLRAPSAGMPSQRNDLKLKSVVTLGASLMVMQVLIFAVSQADVWIAGLCFHTDSVALYGVARRLATAVGMLPQIVGVAISAPIATLNAQGRLVEMQHFLRTSATLAAVPSVVACLLLICAGGLVLESFFGPFYRQSAAVLTVMVVGQAVVAWCGLSGYVLIMTGHQNAVLLVNLFTTAALLAIGPWAGSRFGMLGVSWTSTLLLVFQTIATWALARRYVGVWTHASLAIPLLGHARRQ